MQGQIKKHNMIKNPVVFWLLMAFLVITGIISVIAGYFAYEQKRGELLSELDMQLLQVTNEYKNITEDFWSIYLPVFEVSEDNVRISDYFRTENKEDLSPLERFGLLEALSHMAVRDERVQWIAVYSKQREKNYIYLLTGDTLQEIPEDFPYLKHLNDKKNQMEIYGREEFKVGVQQYNSIAIAGGTLGRMQDGCILVGYDVNQLEKLCEINSGFESLQFDIFKEDEVIFTSGEWKDWPVEAYENGKDGVFTVDGEKWYVQVLDEKLRGEKICYAVKWSELFYGAAKNTVAILLIAFFMAVMAITVYMLILRSLTREVQIIQNGLDVLGSNQLDFRIEESFNQPELVAISEAINQMAQSLKENMERTHEYEQRQIKSELQELQAKFNPHFLYNTLEIFRARCYQNGDDETAELIAQTASIFRGFIGSKTFIPMQEELAFSKRYLALFRARYGESVKVLYDIDTEVLQYGIIRNVFQPLIENYFEHGYNPDNKENYIRFKGRIRDGETILFSVEDNGFGMEEIELQELNMQLRQPIASEKESYGLKNLHQRLQLFYGGDCGLTLRGKEEPGLVIELLIKRKICE